MVVLKNYSKDELIEKFETIKYLLETNSISLENSVSLHFVNEIIGELYDSSEEVPDEN